MTTTLKKISLNGLWQQNPALVQLLGLCPLMAVTTSVVTAFGLGLATLTALLASNFLIAALKSYIPTDFRMPLFVVIIASTVTVIQLLLQAFSYEFYQTLGIFLALITTNCAIMARGESFAYKQAIVPSIVDALFQGLGFLLVLLMLGGLRELLGQGTLFSGASELFGHSFHSIKLTLFTAEEQFLLAILPPGAFILFGFLLALKNYLQRVSS